MGTVTVDEMVSKLDLHGTMMLQGILVNRALQLIHEQKKPESNLLVPDKTIIT